MIHCLVNMRKASHLCECAYDSLCISFALLFEEALQPCLQLSLLDSCAICLATKLLQASPGQTFHHKKNNYWKQPSFFKYIFLASGGGSPLYPEFLQYYTMILQRPRIIVGDAGFEPGTSASEVWCTSNEPPHLQTNTGTESVKPVPCCTGHPDCCLIRHFGWI